MYIGLNNLGLNNLGNNFSPLSLFSTGQQGAWYDPSDFSTMFQDSAGTAPVTAVEQPVGMLRDKSGRGNHAIQATSANRPVVSARYNVLTKTDQLNSWNKTNSSVVDNATAAPDGITFSGSKLIEDSTLGVHRIFLGNTLIAGQYKLIFWAKPAERTALELELRDGAGVSIVFGQFNFSAVTATVTTGAGVLSISPDANGWYKCTAVVTAATGGGSGIALFYLSNGGTDNYQGDGVSGLYLWHPDLRTTADAALKIPAYQRVNTSTDYDTAGFPYYLAFNGTNSSLATIGNIDLTGTAQTSIFAGVYKTSDAAQGNIVELSISANANDGAFYLASPNTAGTVTNLFARGITSTSQAFFTDQAAPYGSVITGLINLSAPSNTIRSNGVQKAQAVTTLGGGNFGSYPLFVGARNSSGVFFLGRIYSLIVRGASSSAVEIANTENWVNSKTMVY